MKSKEYVVAFEIGGPAAMFTRPDTGSSPISYPAPTKSALKSMTECVAFSKGAYFAPRRVEICSPIVFSKYTTNYGGPLRKSGTTNFQMFASILENVCYKIFGIIHEHGATIKGENPSHQLQEVFMRRLFAGQFYTTPFLGWKEFVPSYFGPLRDNTKADQSINITIPSMLDTMYTKAIGGSVFPCYVQDVKIEEGVLHYAK